MKLKLMRVLASYKTAIVSMAVYAVLMAVATVIEKYSGTDAAKALVYYSPLFLLLQLFMVVNCICMAVDRKWVQSRKWGNLLLHGALIVILTGAGITHFFSKDGILSVREGEKTSELIIRNGEKDYRVEKLPFEVELQDFRLIRYPGSNSPSSYESDLLIHIDGRQIEEKVYMNHVLDLQGYRFFQASYDPDEKGTILSVSYDVAGRTVTYIGYFLMLLGFLCCLFGKNTRFRSLIRRLDKAAVVAVLVLAPQFVSGAAPSFHREVSRELAEQFGQLPMLSPQGRIIPVNTFASEIVRKLQLEELPGKCSPEQFILGLWAWPMEWVSEPLLFIEEKELRSQWAEGREFLSYAEAFDTQGHYRFEGEVEKAYQKMPAQRSKLDKEILKFDERVNLLYQLFNYRLVRLFPVPGDVKNHRWLSPGEKAEGVDDRFLMEMGDLFDDLLESVAQDDGGKALEAIAGYQQKYSLVEIYPEKLQAEVRYNRMDLLRHCKRTYLIAGAILLILSIVSWFFHRERKGVKIARTILFVGVLVAFAVHAANMGIRWYISGHAPWSNSYETMVLLSWSAVLGGLLFSRKSFISFSLATILAGVVLFVSELNWMDPQITPLVPVLKSPWLMFHVAVLMVAYGFFGISCMISLTNLIVLAARGRNNRLMLETRVDRLSIINEMSLALGLALMMVGIFLGAIWANESWGRYWSWDPKETWALITGVVYAAVLHLRWLGKKNNLVFNLLAQLSFLTVLMTYFGVNYLLSGMHSYGNTSGLATVPVWGYLLFGMVFILPGTGALLSYFRLSDSKHSSIESR